MESAAAGGSGGDDHIHHHHHHQMRRSRENSNNNNNNNVFVYKECLKNHAASLGSYATDGCGEFTPEDIINLQCLCAACGCHRNFHRKLLVSESQTLQRQQLSQSSPAPEISSDRSGGGGGAKKKRVRTKFTEEQKEKMLELAEKMGWKMQRIRKDQKGENGADADEIDQFCKGVGITRQIFKVWMHNHKNSNSSSSSSSATSSDVLHLTAFNAAAAAATSLRICTTITNTNTNPPTADHQYI